MKTYIKSAKFHEGVFIPGIGDLGKALPSTTKTLVDLEMTVEDGASFLRVTVTRETVLVPLANVISLHVDKYKTATSLENDITVPTIKVKTKTTSAGN